MWTKKGVTLVSLSVLAEISGFYWKDFQFIVLAIMVAFFVLITAIISVFTVSPKLKVKKEVKNLSIVEGDTVPISIDIENHGTSAELVEVHDKIPEYAFRTSGENRLLFNISSLERVSTAYEIRCPLRGFYRLGPTRVRTSDLFNLFYKETDLTKDEVLSVMPNLQEVKGLDLRKMRHIHYPGQYLTPQIGSSTDFYSIRHYMKGDPFKRINWKVSARYKQLMVNEYEKENICDTLIFLDARQVTGLGTPMKNALEHQVKLALSFAHHYLISSNIVGLVVYGEDVKMIPPGSGVGHEQKIRTLLTATYPKDFIPFQMALNQSRLFLMPRTTIILLSTLEYDTTLIPAVRMLFNAGHHVVILTTTSIDYEAPTDKGLPPKGRVALLARENTIAMLERYGALVIECPPDEPISTALQRMITKVRGVRAS